MIFTEIAPQIIGIGTAVGMTIATCLYLLGYTISKLYTMFINYTR